MGNAKWEMDTVAAAAQHKAAAANSIAHLKFNLINPCFPITLTQLTPPTINLPTTALEELK